MTSEDLEEQLVRLGMAKKGRFELMRTWSFHGKSNKGDDRLRNVSTGSLDGDVSDASKRLHLSDLVGDTNTDALDRKLIKSVDRSNMSSSSSKMSKRESLKEKKKCYRSQKKEVAREIMNSAADQTIILMADWLKVRGTLKGWTKLWCLCKPAMLIIYKSEKMKTGHWVGTILLNTCQLMQRPSKKEGFCFKLFHPLDQSIWATKGPKGETIGAFVQPLPVSYLIFRAPSENQGKCWMDALELALRCTSLIKRTTSRPYDLTAALSPDLTALSGQLPGDLINPTTAEDIEDGGEELEETIEAHYSEDDDHSSIGMSESDFELAEEESKPQPIPQVEETTYSPNEVEELGQQGDACQTEEVNDENKSLIWTLVKQVRPGMDLSKVVLPTFILEPRSFLDKLTDYYYHADILSQAVLQETALERMKHVVKWYLSGFYKKPKGLKKPYNPIIGETFRCYWLHPETKSRTFYIAEQISHHPPISAFHVTNRHDGFNINGCILAKSKFYGNSISAILDGVATLTFLERGEDYFITMPYAHCKGILLGTLSMEMGGKVSLDCPKTGYHCDLDFKLKPFFGNGESANRITGRIRMGSEVLCTFEGHWDQQIYIKEITNREKVLFWDPSLEVRSKRLVRYTVPMDAQMDNESEKLWTKVSDAVQISDMHAATSEKHKLEEKQRSEAKERHREKLEWIPKWFSLDGSANKWIYKHVDARPWDAMTDCVQYENDYVINTQTVHNVPKIWKGPPSISQSRIKTYNSRGISEDSDSSEVNTAEICDDIKCRNTNRASSHSEDSQGHGHHKKGSTGDTPPRRGTARTNGVPELNGVVSRKSSTPERVSHYLVSQNNTSTPKQPQHTAAARDWGGDSPSRHGPILTDGSDSPQIKRSTHTPTKASSLTRDFVAPGGHEYQHHHSSHSVPGSPSSVSQKYSPTSAQSPRLGGGSAFSKEFQAVVRMSEAQQEMQVMLSEVLTRVNNMQKSQADFSTQQAQQQHQLQQLQERAGRDNQMLSKDWLLVAIVLVFQLLLQCYLAR